MAPSRFVFASLSLLACSPAASRTSADAPAPAPAPHTATSTALATDGTPPPSAKAASSSNAAPAGVSTKESPAIAEIDLGAFQQELAEPVTSLALGEKRHAALGADAWLSGKEKLEKIALPDQLKPSGPGAARIFFGRDDLPRIMGTRTEGGAPAQLYARYREGRWKAEKNEVGRLLQAPAMPLWGVLGHADPEVACKRDDVCIIKRLSGWKTMPAGPGTPLVELQNGVAFALHPRHLSRLEKDERWVEVGGSAPFEAATGFCVVGEEVWVSEASRDKVHRFAGGAWTSEASPARAPRGLWCPSKTDVWLAAGTGLLHFDGKAWSQAKGVRGPVSEVRARGKELWAAGETGVWRAR